MKLGNLLSARKTIKAHANEAVSVSLAYKMMKFMKASDSEDAFYIAKLKEIIDKYEDKEKREDTKNGIVRIQKDKIGECQSEIRALSDVEVDVPHIHFSLSELSELKLTVTEIFSLDEIINEEG